MRVGELLKQRREFIGKSLEEVALTTRISLDILRRIESEDQEYFRKGTLVRNFVYTYARGIGADTCKVLDAYDAEYSEEKKIKRSLGEFDQTKSFWLSKWTLYGLPILVVIGLMVFITDYIHSNFEVYPLAVGKSKEEKQEEKTSKANLESEQIAVWLADSTDYVGEYILSKDNPMNVNLNP